MGCAALQLVCLGLAHSGERDDGQSWSCATEPLEPAGPLPERSRNSARPLPGRSRISAQPPPHNTKQYIIDPGGAVAQFCATAPPT